jgi:hypothetical protein
VSQAAVPLAASRSSPLEHLEYVLRLAFFAFVPFMVVLLAMLVPMGAAIANMVLALGAFFFGEVLVGAAEKRPWLKRVLRRQLAFEAYYREHPPRPFLYYVFYPLLLPYWLIVAPARREFLLFKGYTLVTLAAISLTGVYRYFWIYQPQLGLAKFLPALLVGLVIESLAVMMLIMPMTTSVVALHRKRQPKRLMLLLAVGLLSAAIAAALMIHRHRTFPSLETRQRIVDRSAIEPVTTRMAMQKALHHAWEVRKKAPKDQWERETDGTVLGKPLDEARASLLTFYRPDEASAFELWTTARKERPGIMILFAEGRKRGRPVWLGMRYDGTIIDKAADVPKNAKLAMRTAGEL